jgi:hypothetical protein
MNLLTTRSRSLATVMRGAMTSSSSRGITYVIDFTEPKEPGQWAGYRPYKDNHFRKFTAQLEEASCDPYPGWRKEHLKPNHKRQMKINKINGRRSNNKVKGIIDLIEFKRDIKMA